LHVASAVTIIKLVIWNKEPHCSCSQHEAFSTSHGEYITAPNTQLCWTYFPTNPPALTFCAWWK